MTIAVKTTARLHFGFMDLHGGLQRRFGSIGSSITDIAWHLEAGKNRQLTVESLTQISPTEIERIKTYAAQILKKLAPKDSVYLRIHQAIPAHAGLGSGTQLALAIGKAISCLYECPLSAVEIALCCDRGTRSGIGIGTFEQGGFIVDGGKVTTTSSRKIATPPILLRVPFPQSWHFILVLDRQHAGLSGGKERTAFNTLPPMPAAIADAICRRILMQLLPALQEQNCVNFGSAINFIQQQIGNCFQPIQGGVYLSIWVEKMLEVLREAGACGVGQSSWGPTGFAVFPDKPSATAALQQLHKQSQRIPDHIHFIICRGNNSPAQVADQGRNKADISLADINKNL